MNDSSRLLDKCDVFAFGGCSESDPSLDLDQEGRATKSAGTRPRRDSGRAGHSLEQVGRLP